MTASPPLRLSPQDAFTRYETIRDRLPQPIRQGQAQTVASLQSLVAHYDLFVLDSFGVLNVGARAIDGAVARVQALGDAGRKVAVLTNAAAQPQQALMEKYHRLGFRFEDTDVISSRLLALTQLARDLPEGPIAVIGDAAKLAPETLRRRAVPADSPAATLFLGAGGWSAADQDALCHRLRNRPHPVFVANPDLVAPREDGLSMEPGHFAHDLIDRTGADVRFFGKPFANAFAAVEARFPDVPPHRIVMVGDTLQTDILGGLARGWGTALITANGSLTGLDIAAAIAQSGLTPDWIMPAI